MLIHISLNKSRGLTHRKRTGTRARSLNRSETKFLPYPIPASRRRLSPPRFSRFEIRPVTRSPLRNNCILCASRDEAAATPFSAALCRLASPPCPPPFYSLARPFIRVSCPKKEGESRVIPGSKGNKSGWRVRCKVVTPPYPTPDLDHLPPSVWRSIPAVSSYPTAQHRTV